MPGLGAREQIPRRFPVPYMPILHLPRVRKMNFTKYEIGCLRHWKSLMTVVRRKSLYSDRDRRFRTSDRPVQRIAFHRFPTRLANQPYQIFPAHASPPPPPPPP